MTKLFLVILNMSITGSFVILAVILLRILLKRMPRIYSYLLWAVVLFRLVCPAAIETSFGIIPNVSIVSDEAKEKETLRTDLSERYVYQPVEASAPKKNTTSGTAESALSELAIPMRGVSNVAWNIISWIWFAGGIMLVVYGIVSYRGLSSKLRRLEKSSCVLKEYENEPVVISAGIETPFTAGFLKPVIYLPEGLNQTDLEMVMEHEKTHIRRRDYLIKTVAYVITCIHWFNPLVWLSFKLMETDMETSCDEAVLKRVGYDKKKAYARTLLSMSKNHVMEIGSCPLAFGESHVKARIKNAVKQKKVKTWIAVVSAVLVCGAAIVLLVNSGGNKTAENEVDVPYEVNTVSDSDNSDKAARSDAPVTDDVSETDNAPVTDNAPETDDAPETDNAPVTDNASVTENAFVTDNASIIEEEIRLQRITENAPETDDAPVTDESVEIPYEAEENPGNETDGDAAILREGVYTDQEILYSCPLEDITISAAYGTRIHPVTGEETYHGGIDFAAQAGTPVYAAADGSVLETGTDSEYGNYIIILHDNGDMTYYTTCDEILAQEGQNVTRGEQIATVGNTGMSTGPHLHFAVSRGGAFIEPVFVSE